MQKALVVGSGGRESAVAWKLAQNPEIEIFAAPGNTGIAEFGTCVPIEANDVEGLTNFADTNGITLMASAPDAAVVAGIADAFTARGVLACAPNKKAARAEGSKAWFKLFLARHNLPTGDFDVFTNADAALAYVKEKGAKNIVIKADGLAGGKGVILPANTAEAEEALLIMMKEKAFGSAGDTVVIEERLSGVERSIIAITDGVTIRHFPMTQDYKRIRDNDEGPNTGGMGAHTLDISEKDDALLKKILADVIAAFAAEGVAYRGYIYLGLIMTNAGPMILECNCRLGDPETEVILPSIDVDLFTLAHAAASGTLADVPEPKKMREALSVVLASGEYPGTVVTNVPILGIESAKTAGALVFHAGTAKQNGAFVTNKAGRVVNVVGTGSSLKEAHEMAYTALKFISFDGMQYRTDIGKSYL